MGPFDSYADLDTGERCLSDGVTMAALQPYNMNFQIFQNERFVAIVHEMYHEYPIIPLDGRPFLPASMGQWLGDARGHWEGDTLVFDTQATWRGEEFTTVVRYRLADDGQTFIGEERMRSGDQGHDNLWVFEKQ